MPAAGTAPKPVDAQHAGITTPHGDHSPHRGGLVLMNGEVHYEVVLSPDGRHQLWFTDAVREDLPASLASNVTLEVMRPGQPAETLAMTIDESGESWRCAGRPLSGADVMVKVRYDLRGAPFEIEIPYVPAVP